MAIGHGGSGFGPLGRARSRWNSVGLVALRRVVPRSAARREGSLPPGTYDLGPPAGRGRKGRSATLATTMQERRSFSAFRVLCLS